MVIIDQNMQLYLNKGNMWLCSTEENVLFIYYK